MDLGSFNKYIVMPKVVVYKNIFNKKDLDNFLRIIKKSENNIDNFEKVSGDMILKTNHGIDPIELENESPINVWVPWYDFGSKTILNYKQMPDNIKDEDLIFVYKFRNIIFDVCDKIFEDYKNDWSNSSYWANYVTNWEIQHPFNPFKNKNSKMQLGNTEILKHDINPEKFFAIGFHTDTPEARLNEPGFKHFITLTFYLNDDYDGGEVQFINELEKKLITYKPKAGDITVFPSGSPYWHAAKGVVAKNNKFFIRIFISWKHEGNAEWEKNVKKYGEDQWKKINSERIKKEINEGKYTRSINIEGKDFSGDPDATIIYIKKEDDIYIDGRKF